MTSLNLSEHDFSMFRNLIYKECGICFNSINRSVLETRLVKSLRKHNLDSVGQFYDLISSDSRELADFLDEVTTNLTRFFRIEKHFEILAEVIFPAIMKSKSEKGQRDISIWSAGCSTGEEPYSIAMTCLETLGMERFNIKIFASDISLKCLIKAKEGVYDASHVESVPEKYINKYFDKTDTKYIVKKEVKRLITFDYHNLMHVGIQKNIDVILCRNVLIYFDESGRQQTERRFYDALNYGGYLLIGHSEFLFGSSSSSFSYNTIRDIGVYIKDKI